MAGEMAWLEKWHGWKDGGKGSWRSGWRNGMAGKMPGRVAGGALFIGGKGPTHIRSLRTS
jgi:hypothetical protein